MNIGDRVRSLKGSEEGVIVRFLGQSQVEIEIEDGFRVPFDRKELVVVSTEESRIWGTPEPKKGTKTEQSSAPIVAEKGVFLAFVHHNDKELEVYLINNTDTIVSFNFGEEAGLPPLYKGIQTGQLKPKAFQKVYHVSLQNFDKWPYFIVQMLFFRLGASKLYAPLVRKFRFRAEQFFKAASKEAPLLRQKGYLFQIDDQTPAPEQPQTLAPAVKEQKPDPEKQKPDPEKLLDAMFKPVAPADGMSKVVASTKKVVPGKKLTVDLHAEALPGGRNLSADQILAAQLDEFERKLDDALCAGVDELLFIHGVGNGVLRTEIQRRLSRHPHVAYFKDAQREKFGYGATVAKLK